MTEQYPYIIAELSGNHHGSFERACDIIRAAHYAGATAVKLQTYTPETMVADHDYKITKGPWTGRKVGELYSQAMTPWEWHQELFDLCQVLGMDCFSTPFDETAVDFLETLNCPLYKVASFEITDIPLIRYIAKTKKPMIISTGMSRYDEIETAILHAKDAGCRDIVLLKCTSAYPSEAKDANLLTMVDMHKEFSWPVGISDHSKGTAIPIAAVMMGASMIEKHLTLDDDEGPDSHFSLKPEEFRQMVIEVRNACDAIGNANYGPTKAEEESLVFRRSLFIIKDMKSGETVTPDRCKARRPNVGISPEAFEAVMGRRLKTDVKAGTALQWGMLSDENDNLQ